MNVKVLVLDSDGIGRIVDGTLENGKLMTDEFAVFVDSQKHVLIEKEVLPGIKQRIPLFLIDWSKPTPIQIFPTTSKKVSYYTPSTIKKLLDLNLLGNLLGGVSRRRFDVKSLVKLLVAGAFMLVGLKYLGVF